MSAEIRKLTIEEISRKAESEAQANVKRLYATFDIESIVEAELERVEKRNASIEDALASVSRLQELFSTFSACRNGCSYCCKQSVLVSHVEAEYISSKTGLLLNSSPDTVHTEDDVVALREKYNGVPCQFLQEGRCSIYAYRPVACRALINLSSTSEVCSTDMYSGAMVPAADQTVLFAPMFSYLMKHGVTGPDEVRYADIRSWFNTISND